LDSGTDQTVLGLAMIEWSVVLAQFPIILSLMTFTLLLVPVRIPTLSMLTGDDVDFDEELKAQGMGNIVSGAFGSVHNYLSYSNSVFFFNVGGWGKTSQGAIALATLILFVIGPQIINYVPRIIAGVIMFHLGYDLVNDAVILSRPALDSLEYMSVLFVGCVVMVFGFVTGEIYVLGVFLGSLFK
jgi:SulP family sulfate permease